MKHLKGFHRYEPVSPLGAGFPMENIDNPHLEETEVRRHHLALLCEEHKGAEHRPLFYQDETGKCWYDAMNEFSEGTTKIVYCPNTGRVISFNKDATLVFPHENNVIEVAEVPDGFKADLFMVTPSGNLVPYSDEIRKLNLSQQTHLLMRANGHHTALVFITHKTDAQISEMETLQTFMVEIKQREISLTEEMQWPELPL